jgi:hypothetical protein
VAQQISLVDLSGASFTWLRDAVSEAADRLYSARNRHSITRFPVSRMRRKLRAALGTPVLSDPGAGWEPDDEPMALNAPVFSVAAAQVIAEFAAVFRGRDSRELLLGFPAAPFILPLATDDPAGFVDYARLQPAHPIALRRTGTGQGAEWEVFPRHAPDAYRLTFNLPDRVEEWISENDDWQSKRTRIIKNDLLPHITIYRREHEAVHVYQLRYEPSEFHRPRA